MELWIRSQNKEILQKTNALFISHSEENIWSIIDNQNMTKYGTYKTLERALEVLDEIQTAIIYCSCNLPEEIEEIKKKIKSPFSMNLKTNSMVYIMPEE